MNWPIGSCAGLLADVDAAEASIAAGKGRIVTERSMKYLANEVKQRGWTRLAAIERSAGNGLPSARGRRKPTLTKSGSIRPRKAAT